MALVDKTRGRRVIVHGSDVVVDQIEVQSHTGTRTPNVFLGSAPAQTHNGAAVLLCLSAPGIKKVPNIVDANDIGHVNLAGFRVDLDLDKVGLSPHRVPGEVSFAIHGQRSHSADNRMSD